MNLDRKVRVGIGQGFSWFRPTGDNDRVHIRLERAYNSVNRFDTAVMDLPPLWSIASRKEREAE